MQNRLSNIGTLLAVAVAVLNLAAPGSATTLERKTVEGFDHYVMVTESRISGELKGESFLWIDTMPRPIADEHYSELRRGELYIESLSSQENGRPVEVPDGLVHHWIGIVFIPGATIQSTLAVLQDYENHQNIYAPYVRRSKLLQRNGNDFQIFLQFYRKAIITAGIDANFDVHYFSLDAVHICSRTYSTRIAEVEDVGLPGEREKPVGTGRGFLWRLNTYGRLVQKDGGVYYQMETIALSRRVPMGFGWLINPLVKRIPRESLSLLLNRTRKAVLVEVDRKEADLLHPKMTTTPNDNVRKSYGRSCSMLRLEDVAKTTADTQTTPTR